VTEFRHVYGSALLATALGSATIMWQAKTANTGVKNKIKKYVNGSKDELKADIARVEKNLKDDIARVEKNLKDDIARVEAEAQDCQAMILENGHHVMHALDGNKKPLREWLRKLERCKNSGGEDCGSISKAEGVSVRPKE
jgi:predicted phage gp36 major capsid-like protein